MDTDLWKWGEEDIPDGGKHAGNDTAARKHMVIWGANKRFCMIGRVGVAQVP